MAFLLLRTALWRQVTRTLSVLLLVSLSPLAGPMQAQTTETACPPEPVFDENGTLDEAAYQAGLEQCQQVDVEKRLQARMQEPLSVSRALGIAEAATAVLEQDSLALVAFYYSTDGPSWSGGYANWLTGPVSTWFGVTVSDGRVVGLDFEEEIYFTGTLPPELGNLTGLQVLDLSYNFLTGSIPPELGNLTNLQILRLDHNQFSGSIPPELGSLTSLTYLNLSGNQLSGAIPPELGNLSSLWILNLAHNQLSGSIPPELGQLSSLDYLDLSINQLSGSIPAELGNLNYLRDLRLTANALVGNIPPELGQLSNLEHLYLHDNQLSGSIPPELSNLTSVTDLDFSENQLSGGIPPELGNLISLQYLDLSSNVFIGGLPVTLISLINLNNFYFDHTNLCVPQDPDFLTWLQGIDYVHSSGIACEAPTSPAELVVYWPLDGSTLDDVNGLKAIRFGGPNFVPGVSGQALRFDGQNDYAVVKEHPSLNPTDGLTLAAWLFREYGSTGATGLEKRYSYRLLSVQAAPSTARWFFDFWNDEGAYYRLTARTPVENQTWHHVAATFDGSTVKLYVDGKLDNSMPAQGKLRVAATNLEMARRDLSKYFKGKIDEVRLYDGALTAGEVAALYAGEADAAAAMAPALGAAEEVVPTAYVLEGNYPNPFNPATEIRFGLPEAADVTLVVYDVTGREVARLAEGPMEAGYHAVRWEASGMPSGVYLYRLTAGTFTEARTMVLLK